MRVGSLPARVCGLFAGLMAACASVVPLSSQAANGAPQLLKLGPSGENGDGDFGLSVALSADGSTALVGAPFDHPATGAPIPAGVGAVWVFTRSGSGWTQQAGPLTARDETGNGGFGSGVALSADGNVAVVGGSSDNNGNGAVWVFTRTGATWSQQGGKLTATDARGPGAAFGFAVALSSDGSTLLIGGANDCNGGGAVWVYARSSATLTEQANLRFGECTATGALFGSSVALSADGSTALVGAGGAAVGPQGSGGAFVYTRSGSTWTKQGDVLVAADAAPNDHAGGSVALSADGITALVGAPAHANGAGAVWVFARTGSTWAQQGSALTPSDEKGAGLFGSGVAVSADGTTVLLGAPNDDSRAGAAWIFTRAGSTWTQQGSKLMPTGEKGAGAFGSHVAVVSVAGSSTVLIGAPNDSPGPPVGPSNIPVGVGGAWASAAAPAASSSPPPAVPGISPKAATPAQASTTSEGFSWWILLLILLVLIVVSILSLIVWRRRRQDEEEDEATS